MARPNTGNEHDAVHPLWCSSSYLCGCSPGRFILLASTPAAAGPFLFGGASLAGGGERSEYAGVSGNFLPVSFLTQKLVISDYHYKYGSNGTTVSVNGQSAEAAIGVQKGWESGWAEASVGARYRYNRVSPEGADNRSDGGEWGLALTVLGQQEFASNGPSTALRATISGLRLTGRAGACSIRSLAMPGPARDHQAWRPVLPRHAGWAGADRHFPW